MRIENFNARKRHQHLTNKNEREIMKFAKKIKTYNRKGRKALIMILINGLLNFVLHFADVSSLY
jgi:hypothetical protein